MRETSQDKETEVFLIGGIALQVDDSFEEIMALLDCREIAENDFIYLKHKDGCRTAFRKQEVVAVNEYQDTEDL